MIAERLNRDRTSNDQRLTAALAGRSVEDAAAIIAAHDAATDAAKDEVTRANDARVASEATAAQAVEAARSANLRAELLVQLSRTSLDVDGLTPLPPVNPDFLDPVLALALTSALASPTPETAVADAVRTVRASMAPMFGAPTVDPNAATPPASANPLLPPPPALPGAITGAPAPAPVPGRPVGQGQTAAPSLAEQAVEAYKASKGIKPPAPPPA